MEASPTSLSAKSPSVKLKEKKASSCPPKLGGGTEKVAWLCLWKAYTLQENVHEVPQGRAPSGTPFTCSSQVEPSQKSHYKSEATKQVNDSILPLEVLNPPGHYGA